MPKFKLELKSFQKEALEFALSTNYHICGLEMGLGKTAVALALACKTEGKTLAVVPAYLKRNWLSEIDKFTEDLDIDVVSYSALGKSDLKGYSLIIADECHYLKNIDANRTKHFHNLVIQSNPDRLMLMSGTPVKNKPSEFWSLLQLCYYGKEYDQFERYYARPMRFNKTFSNERSFPVNGIVVRSFRGVKNAPELKKLIKPVYIRKRAVDCLDLPEMVDINFIDKNKNQYDDKLKEAFRLFEIEKDPSYMSLKNANALAKVDISVKLAKDKIEQGQKVIIFTCHRESCAQIAKGLKCQYIDGSVDVDKRHVIVTNFNNSKEPCAIVLTIGAGSTGYNITSCNQMIINDFPFVHTDLDQAKKRIHRIGQNRTCFYTYIFASETDKAIFKTVQGKRRDIEKIYK